MLVYSRSNNKSLKLDWLLSCFPSLKELNITVSRLTIVGSETNLVQYPQAVLPTTTRHSNTSPWYYQRHTGQSLPFWQSGQPIVTDQLQNYESSHLTRSQPSQQNQRGLCRNVIYTMDLSDKKMEILRLQTNFMYEGRFLLRVKTSDQIFGCSFRTFHKGHFEFISKVDMVTYRQSPFPEVIIKCDSIKKLIVDKAAIPLNNQL